MSRAAIGPSQVDPIRPDWTRLDHRRFRPFLWSDTISFYSIWLGSLQFYSVLFDFIRPSSILLSYSVLFDSMMSSSILLDPVRPYLILIAIIRFNLSLFDSIWLYLILFASCLILPFPVLSWSGIIPKFFYWFSLKKLFVNTTLKKNISFFFLLLILNLPFWELYVVELVCDSFFVLFRLNIFSSNWEKIDKI